MKYKVGDKVRVRKNLVPDTEYGGLTLHAGPMSDLRGKTMKVIAVDGEFIRGSKGFWWNSEMIKPVKTKTSTV